VPSSARAYGLGFLFIAVLSSRISASPKNAPAVIINPSAQSVKELRRVIQKALPAMAVTLVEDALTQSSFLSLEHPHARDPMGQPLNGRDLSRPETFELYKRESRCILKQLSTGRSFELHHVQCETVPLSSRAERELSGARR
jgi:hypothetical protein